MTKLLILFYKLPLDLIARAVLILTCIWIRLQQRCARCRWLRPGLWAALLLWCAVVLWVTILTRSPGTVYPPEWIPFHSYREVFTGGNEELLRSNFMNAVLFYPAGVLMASLLPESRPKGRKLLLLALAVALFSLAIEGCQLCLALGEPEIDDVLHNTVGAVLGAGPIAWKDCLHAPAHQTKQWDI